MRILHTSDWHLGRYLEQVSRISEQREFIDFLCRTAEEQCIDLVLISGDVYDTYNPPAAAEELFYDALDRLSAKGRRAVVVTAGNHDNPERLCAASPLAGRNGIVLLGYPASEAAISADPAATVQVVRSGPGWLELAVAGCGHHAVLLALPYPSEARLEEVLEAEADEAEMQKAYSEKIGSVFRSLEVYSRGDTVNLARGHLFMLGGKSSESERTRQEGGALTDDPAGLPEKAHYVALGHLHRPQRIKDAPCPAYYSGSPLAYSFSESDYKKCVFIVDAAPDREAEITEYSLDCGKPLRRWKASEGIEQAVRWCEENRDPDAWIDLEIHTDRVLTQEEQKRLRELNSGILHIRPLITNQAADGVSLESREGRRIEQLFGDYYQYRTGAVMSEELMQLFLDVVNDGGQEAGEGAAQDAMPDAVPEENDGDGERIETKVS